MSRILSVRDDPRRVGLSGVLAIGFLATALFVPFAANAGETDVEAPPGSTLPSDVEAAESSRIEQTLLMSYLADQSTFTLYDARSPGEYEAGHVDGAVNLPIDQVEAGSAKLPSDVDEPILVYCKSGRRASVVAGTLKQLGYTNVRVLPSEQLMFHDGLIVFNCGA